MEPETQTHRTDKSTIAKMVVGLLIVVVGFAILFYSARNQRKEFSLIRYGQTTKGYITGCTQKLDVEGYPYYYCNYTFTLPDGRTFQKRSMSMSGSLKAELTDLTKPYPAEIEYLADNPETSRIKGFGSTHLFSWALHTFGALLAAFAIFAFAGGLIFAEGMKEFRKPLNIH